MRLKCLLEKKALKENYNKRGSIGDYLPRLPLKSNPSLIDLFVYLFCHTSNIMKTIKKRKNRFNNGDETKRKL